MTLALEQESQRLASCWMRHEARLLREYLIGGVEDPRINLQSIFSRHFLAWALTANRYRALMEHEYRFAAALNWLTRLAGEGGDGEQLAAVLHALQRRGDNAEGLELPRFLTRTWALLPASACGLTVPNYLASFLAGARFEGGQAQLHQPSLDTCCGLWRALLAGPEDLASAFHEPPPHPVNLNPAPALKRSMIGTHSRQEDVASLEPAGAFAWGETESAGLPRALPQSGTARVPPRPRVLEPACGSANDYRFLDASGLAALIDYTGLDLCPKNVDNARALFPGVRFQAGNVFDIAAPDKSFDLCFVHDLFEHLSPEGLEAAVREICRVTRRGICASFFNMDEIPDHEVRPVLDYYWNRLSMARTRESFARAGFAAQVLHVGTFLRHQTGCDQTHNPNAYTFLLEAAQSSSPAPHSAAGP